MGPRRIKGPARALKSPIKRERRHRALDRQTEELLFRCAEVITEGSAREGVWYGSTMITFDLERIAAELREPLDAERRAELATLVAGSVRVRIRAMRIARAEAARRCPEEKLGTASVETRVELRNGDLLLDVDLEVPFRVSSAKRR
jgi:hypothetical protein